VSVGFRLRAHQCAAAASGPVTVVAVLLEAGASPNEADATTPLGNASAAGHAAVVRALIAAGADLDERTRIDGRAGVLHHGAIAR
jgi:hypothetical protein